MKKQPRKVAFHVATANDFLAHTPGIGEAWAPLLGDLAELSREDGFRVGVETLRAFLPPALHRAIDWIETAADCVVTGALPEPDIIERIERPFIRLLADVRAGRLPKRALPPYLRGQV